MIKRILYDSVRTTTDYYWMEMNGAMEKMKGILILLSKAMKELWSLVISIDINIVCFSPWGLLIWTFQGQSSFK